MQSMIASQQQLMRRSLNNNNNNNYSINSNNNSNNINNINPNNSNNQLKPLSCDEWSDSPTITSDNSRDDSQLMVNNSRPESRQNLCSSVETIQSIASDLSNSDIKKSDNKSQVKKKRSNSSWLNLLNPSYKSRHEEFKRLFSNSVPNNERLVVDYSCALQKEILIQGRLYLSLNYIAFYANIFKWETSLVIKCRDITSLSKANTARVIPNAIQVITNSGDKYVFASFAARDKTHVMLFRLWQNALLDQPMSSAELWQWVHYSYGEDLGLTSDDDEEYNNDNMINSISTHSQVINTDNSDSCNSSDPDFSAEPEVYEDCLDHLLVSSQCMCGTHDGKLILNATFPVSVDRAFEYMFTDNKFIHNLHKSRRTYDLCVSEWEVTQNGKVRQLTYTVALNHALVKSARTIENQRLLSSSIPGSLYMVKSEADNEGIPYCDTFSVHSQWCLTQDSQNVTRLKVHAKVFYKKNIWGLGLMKPIIEKSSIQGVTDYCNDLFNELPLWIEMERNLATVDPLTELRINAKNIDYMDSVSSISSINDPLALNGIDLSERHKIRSSVDLKNISNGMLSKMFHLQSNDAFLLKLILLILLLIFILNIMVFIRLWQIESKLHDFDALSFANSQIPENTMKWKEFIDNAIKNVRIMETNLLQLKQNIKDEL